MSDARSPEPIDLEPVVRSALRMMITGVDEPGVFTADVTGVTPLGEVHGLDDLRDQVSDWRDGLTDADLEVVGLAIDGTTAMVRWRLIAHHTSGVLVNEDELFEPTGRLVGLAVASELWFRDGQIYRFRHDYDLEELLRQLRPA